MPSINENELGRPILRLQTLAAATQLMWWPFQKAKKEYMFKGGPGPGNTKNQAEVWPPFPDLLGLS
jgi:hypothetical protein